MDQQPQPHPHYANDPLVMTVVDTGNPPAKHFLIAFFFSFMWGTFGVDRFYLGYIGSGMMKLVTLGGFGIWTAVDLITIMNGAMRDKWDRPLVEAEKYRLFARKVVRRFSYIVAIALLLLIVASSIALYYLVTFVMNGGLQSLVPGLPPELMNGIQGSSTTPSF